MNAWQEILNFLKSKVNPQSYQTWLQPTRFSHATKDTLVVRVPNREFQDWIQENYGAFVLEAMEKLQLDFRQIRYDFEAAQGKEVHMRTGALVRAVVRLNDALLTRGIYP